MRSTAPQTALWGGPRPRFEPGTGDQIMLFIYIFSQKTDALGLYFLKFYCTQSELRSWEMVHSLCCTIAGTRTGALTMGNSYQYEYTMYIGHVLSPMGSISKQLSTL